MVDAQNPMKTFVCSTLRDQFKVTSGHSLYLVLSRPVQGPTSSYSSTRNNDLEMWKHGLVAKRILDLNVFLMAPKNSWTLGTIYTEYTDDMVSGVDATKHYVTTADGNVYICIDNNGGSKSTQAPSGSGTNDISTSDGYIWKYVMTITDDLFDYTTDDLIPIRTLEVDTSDANRFADGRSLQYEVQFNATEGAIHKIDVTSNTAAYNAHTTKGEVTSSASADATIIQVNNDAFTNVNSPVSPVGYEVRFTSGNAVGIGRKISNYSAINGSSTLTLESSLGVTLDGGIPGAFEVLPIINVHGLGEGSGADAKAVMDSSNKVSNVTMIDRGSGYKFASAEVETTASSGTAPDLDVQISPRGGHGSDPVNQILPSKVMISGVVERDLTVVPSETNQKSILFQVENGYSQYSLVLDPQIGGTGPNSGKIAGTEVDRFSLLKVSTFSGESVTGLNYSAGDFIMGVDSHAGGQITEVRELSDTVLSIDLKEVSGNFKASETIVGLTGSADTSFTSSGKGKSKFQFQEDRYLGTNTNNYSLMTILGVERPGGIEPSDLDLDDLITGASGSTGIMVFSDSTSSGTTANYYITGITGGTAAGGYGFTIGESVFVNGGVSAHINTIDTPGLRSGTGTVLHSEHIDMITRHPEQTEFLRIILDI